MINRETFSTLYSVENELQERFSITSGFELTAENAEDIEVVVTDDHVFVSFLQLDSYPQPFFEDINSQLIEFRSSQHVNEVMKTLKKSNKLYYVLNKYSHGSVHYSVSGTVSYPDEKWDVSHSCGVFIPESYIQKEFKKLKKTDPDAKNNKKFIEDSNEILSSYSKWCNGEVFGYCVTVFDKNGKEISEDSSYGIIGSENANKEKNYVLESLILNHEVQKELKNINIINIDPKDFTAPFKISKKDIVSINHVKINNKSIYAVKRNDDFASAIYTFTDGEEKSVVHKYSKVLKDNYGTSVDSFLSANIKSFIQSELRETIKFNLNNNLENKSKKLKF